MIGCDGSTILVSNAPVPCRWNWAPTSAMYFGELRKQYDAQWSGTNPPPLVDVVEQGLFLLGGDLGRCWRRSRGRRTCASVSRVQVAELSRCR